LPRRRCDHDAARWTGIFNEIKRLIGGISQRMLTLTLRGLPRDGLSVRFIQVAAIALTRKEI